MTPALIVLAVLTALSLLREREVRKERERWETERKSLLDRIQFPAVRQVQSGSYEPHEAPEDAAELAWVGQEVPSFVNLGEENHDGS